MRIIVRSKIERDYSVHQINLYLSEVMRISLEDTHFEDR